MLLLRPAKRGGGSPQRHHLAAMLDRGVLKLMQCQRQVLEIHPWCVGGLDRNGLDSPAGIFVAFQLLLSRSLYEQPKYMAGPPDGVA